MAIKEIDVPDRTRILIEVPSEEQRFVVTIDPAAVHIANDKCPHRGGPIHLCYKDERNVLRCPWHDRRVREDSPAESVCATYYRSSGLLRLVSDYPTETLWPTRVVACHTPASRFPNARPCPTRRGDEVELSPTRAEKFVR